MFLKEIVNCDIISMSKLVATSCINMNDEYIEQFDMIKVNILMNLYSFKYNPL